jgi:ABC-2 type transport system permease protein
LKNKRKDIRRNNIIQLILGIAVIILVNVIGFYVFKRFDLTSEKRYTLSEPTKHMLENLDDIVYFEIFLDGEFPAGFKRLQRETREMLDQFRAYSDNIQYEFINPSASSDELERNDVYRRLVERGLNPTDLQVKTNDGSSQQIIFPGAIVSHKDKEMPLELLKTQMNLPPEEVLNNSIQKLEFNIANTIRKLTLVKRPKLAIIEGHGELEHLQMADITYALNEYYTISRIKLDGMLNSLSDRELAGDSTTVIVSNKFDAIIIAKPDSAFSERDKFIIDQFIMRGGRVLWLIDPVFASMDSIQNADVTMGIINDLNLSDQLFNYGVRLNTNLVMDLNALPIPIQTGQVGGQPQYDFFPWFYFPVIFPVSDHPIVKNLNAIKTEFISSIDTINTKGVKKTILLTSSQYARTVNTPVMITLDILMEEPNRDMFKQAYVPLAGLLEGNFKSLYKNRVPPELKDSKEVDFKEESVPTKMIVIADGDVIKNHIRYSGEKPVPYPLGYDIYTQQTFGNKEFILNAMNYLIDDSGLISIRSRELKLRLLDRTRIKENKLFWQMLNTALPVLLVLIFGFLFTFIRKKRFSK